MPRYVLRGFQAVIDLSVLSIAYWLAFLFRFEFQIPSTWLQSALINWPYVIALEYSTLATFSVLRMSWRYISMREIVRIGIACWAATTLVVSLRLLAGGLEFEGNLFMLPLSVIAMNAVLGFVGLTTVRASRRLQAEEQERKRRANGIHRKRALLIGAGQAGVLVAREIANRPDLGLDPVGFLDDDVRKVGTRIGGLPVLGTTARILEIAERKRVKRILITIANAAGQEIRRITTQCKDAGLDTKIIPGLHEIVGDRINLSRIRDVAIEDLLGREPVKLDEESLADSLRGHCVVVTGAGGSIGSELCRQVARFAPAQLILVERFENALFEIHRELIAAFPKLSILPQIADVGDVARMERIFATTKPRVVFHAAAHKHVPMMEHNPGEALKNNIGGTRTVASLADKHGVAQFVLVSTDKAVNPSSIMGCSKRVAELVCQARAQRSKTRFVTVRFGNVLGSAGSVIPIFKQQIAQGGPVTVTHPEMQRYFMTIPEAAQLVMQAGAMGQGGEVFILDMGRPVKIVDLAKDLITLSGLRPDEDIEIAFSGVRPGEKLFEELSTGAESADKTKHPKIFIGKVAAPLAAEVEAGVDHLLAIANEADLDAIRASLRKLVPEFQAPGDPAQAAAPEEPEAARSPTRRTGANAALPAPAVSWAAMARLLLSPPDLAGTEIEMLGDAVQSGWIAPLGPHVDAFEREMCHRLDVPHALALASGTAALHLALVVAGVQAGDQVWLSDLTFAATANAVTYVGATPVFIDSERATWNMDPQLLEQALDDAARKGALPRAVIVVDLYGQCAELERIVAACRRHDVVVIEDAAEALGATYRGHAAGSFGDLSILSFNGNKIITTSGGGMLLSRRGDWIERARYLATQARQPARHYEHTEVGYNYRLSNLLAAVGRAQLADLDRRVAARRAINAAYRTALGLPGWTFMPEAPGHTCTFWLTCATIDARKFGATRDQVIDALAAADIEARPVWKPMHLQPVFEGHRVIGGDVGASLFTDGICLPSGSRMTAADVERVVSVIHGLERHG